MKTKILLLIVALVATVPAVAQPPPKSAPQHIVTIDYYPCAPYARGPWLRWWLFTVTWSVFM